MPRRSSPCSNAAASRSRPGSTICSIRRSSTRAARSKSSAPWWWRRGRWDEGVLLLPLGRVREWPWREGAILLLQESDLSREGIPGSGTENCMVDLVRAKREQILRLARRHGVTKVRVFGSMARGDAGPRSDVDLLVDVGANTSPWFTGGLVTELEEILGRRVEVITERGLDDLLRDHVLEEAVLL